MYTQFPAVTFCSFTALLYHIKMKGLTTRNWVINSNWSCNSFANRQKSQFDSFPLLLCQNKNVFFIDKKFRSELFLFRPIIPLRRYWGLKRSVFWGIFAWLTCVPVSHSCVYNLLTPLLLHSYELDFVTLVTAKTTVNGEVQNPGITKSMSVTVHA